MYSQRRQRGNATKEVVVLWVCIALLEVVKSQRPTGIVWLTGAALGAAVFMIHALHPRGAYYGMPIIAAVATLVVVGLMVTGAVLMPREVVVAFGLGYTAYPLAQCLFRTVPTRPGSTLG